MQTSLFSVSSRSGVLLLLAASFPNLLISISGVLPGRGLGVMVDVVTAKQFVFMLCVFIIKLTISPSSHQISCPILEEEFPCHPPS